MEALRVQLLVRRIVRGYGRRHTRLHSERGQLLPVRLWPQVPFAITHRIAGASREQPWLSRSVLDWLKHHVTPEWRILELGSGWSTTWLARRCDSIISMEHDQQWHARVAEVVNTSGLRNVDLRLVGLGDYPMCLGQFNEAQFDLVIVDHSERTLGERLQSLKAATRIVKDGGFLMLDDSDKPELKAVDQLLADWPSEKFLGFKAVPLVVVETLLFEKPDRTHQ